MCLEIKLKLLWYILINLKNVNERNDFEHRNNNIMLSLSKNIMENVYLKKYISSIFLHKNFSNKIFCKDIKTRDLSNQLTVIFNFYPIEEVSYLFAEFLLKYPHALKRFRKPCISDMPLFCKYAIKIEMKKMVDKTIIEVFKL